MLQSLIDLIQEMGFSYVTWRMSVMWGVALVLFYFAVYKQFEPLLLVPIAFGSLIANLPTEGIVNKPSDYLFTPTAGVVQNVFVEHGGKVTVPIHKDIEPKTQFVPIITVMSRESNHWLFI